jgi:signal transduction histidine kinase
MANLFFGLGKADSVTYYAREAMNGFKKVGNYTGLSSAYSFMYTFQKKEGNSDSAYYFLQLYSVLNDSLKKAEKETIDAYQNVGFNQQIEMQERERKQIQKENSIRTYALLSGVAVFMFTAFLLYRNNRNRKKANQLLQKQKEEIEIQKRNVEITLTDLKSTQAQLIQSEKMASLGELTAGIAHEIQNPLNFVNNFSEVSKELLAEMKEELAAGSSVEAKAIADDVIQNLEKINHHGKRADAIVKGMLEHSRVGSGEKVPTDINALADEYLRLAYHGLKAKDPSFSAAMKADFDPAIGSINIIPQDIGRVLLNLINNALYAVNERSKEQVIGYEPAVSVCTKKVNGELEISIADNGNGIPEKVLDKVFQPFFTTKPTGQGTGLGLSLSYDIIKAHQGKINIRNTPGEGAEFIINLPINA